MSTSSQAVERDLGVVEKDLGVVWGLDLKTRLAHYSGVDTSFQSLNLQANVERVERILESHGSKKLDDILPELLAVGHDVARGHVRWDGGASDNDQGKSSNNSRAEEYLKQEVWDLWRRCLLLQPIPARTSTQATVLGDTSDIQQLLDSAGGSASQDSNADSLPSPATSLNKDRAAMQGFVNHFARADNLMEHAFLQRNFSLVIMALMIMMAGGAKTLFRDRFEEAQREREKAIRKREVAEAKSRGVLIPRKKAQPKAERQNDPDVIRRNRVSTVKMNTVLCCVSSIVVLLSGRDLYTEHGNLEWPSVARAAKWFASHRQTLPPHFIQMEGVTWAAIVYAIARARTSRLNPDDSYAEYASVFHVLLRESKRLATEVQAAGLMPELSYNQHKAGTRKRFAITQDVEQGHSAKKLRTEADAAGSTLEQDEDEVQEIDAHSFPVGLMERHARYHLKSEPLEFNIIPPQDAADETDLQYEDGDPSVADQANEQMQDGPNNGPDNGQEHAVMTLADEIDGHPGLFASLANGSPSFQDIDMTGSPSIPTAPHPHPHPSPRPDIIPTITPQVSAPVPLPRSLSPHPSVVPTVISPTTPHPHPHPHPHPYPHPPPHPDIIPAITPEVSAPDFPPLSPALHPGVVPTVTPDLPGPVPRLRSQSPRPDTVPTNPPDSPLSSIEESEQDEPNENPATKPVFEQKDNQSKPIDPLTDIVTGPRSSRAKLGPGAYTKEKVVATVKGSGASLVDKYKKKDTTGKGKETEDDMEDQEADPQDDADGSEEEEVQVKKKKSKASRPQPTKRNWKIRTSDQLPQLLPKRRLPELWNEHRSSKSFKLFGDTVHATVFGQSAIDDVTELCKEGLRVWDGQESKAAVEIMLEDDRYPWMMQDEGVEAVWGSRVRRHLASGQTVVIRAHSHADPCFDNFESELLQRLPSTVRCEVQVPGISGVDGNPETKDIVWMDIGEFLEIGRNADGCATGINMLSPQCSRADACAEFARRWNINWDAAFDLSANRLANDVRQPPNRQVNFIIAGQRGAYSTMHIDASGLCTVVMVITGTKYWVIRWIKDPKLVFHDPRMLQGDQWETTVIRLVAGDLLFMPPGTVHEVLTTNDSLTVGGHFLVPELLPATLATALRLGHMRPSNTAPVNAWHNSVTRCLVDRAAMAALGPAEDILLELQKTSEVADQAENETTIEMERLARCPDFLNMAAAVILGDLAFDPSFDERKDVLEYEDDQHAEVLQWMGLFIRWCTKRKNCDFLQVLEPKIGEVIRMSLPQGDARISKVMQEMLQWVQSW